MRYSHAKFTNHHEVKIFFDDPKIKRFTSQDTEDTIFGYWYMEIYKSYYTGFIPLSKRNHIVIKKYVL